MDKATIFEQNANNFYDSLTEDKNGRYLSWEHCYYQFYHARKKQLPENDIDHLTLQLAFYLASWGMYRGSSFLLWKDYKVHIPAVKEILSCEYDKLLGIKCDELSLVENQKSLTKLYKKLEEHYTYVRRTIKGNTPKSNISSILITKILMGTLGCVPAYDRYFIYGIKKYGVATSTYNLNSILMLCDFYQKNKAQFNISCSKMKVKDVPYPEMKFLDMGFWQIGYSEDMATKKKTKR